MGAQILGKSWVAGKRHRRVRREPTECESDQRHHNLFRFPGAGTSARSENDACPGGTQAVPGIRSRVSLRHKQSLRDPGTVRPTPRRDGGRRVQERSFDLGLTDGLWRGFARHKFRRHAPTLDSLRRWIVVVARQQPTNPAALPAGKNCAPSRAVQEGISRRFFALRRNGRRMSPAAPASVRLAKRPF
jgi:hypothetical protein